MIIGILAAPVDDDISRKEILATRAAPRTSARSTRMFLMTLSIPSGMAARAPTHFPYNAGILQEDDVLLFFPVNSPIIPVVLMIVKKAPATSPRRSNLRRPRLFQTLVAIGIS